MILRTTCKLAFLVLLGLLLSLFHVALQVTPQANHQKGTKLTTLAVMVSEAMNFTRIMSVSVTRKLQSRGGGTLLFKLCF
jgi:hypothetical protein